MTTISETNNMIEVEKILLAQSLLMTSVEFYKKYIESK